MFWWPSSSRLYRLKIYHGCHLRLCCKLSTFETTKRKTINYTWRIKLCIHIWRYLQPSHQPRTSLPLPLPRNSRWVCHSHRLLACLQRTAVSHKSNVFSCFNTLNHQLLHMYSTFHFFIYFTMSSFFLSPAFTWPNCRIMLHYNGLDTTQYF